MRLKKIALGSTVVMLLALLVPMVFANGNGEPGLSPGFWKHNVRVALDYPGGYSTPHEGEDPMDYDSMVALAKTATGETDATTALEAALAALTAKGPGSDMIRLGMANAFNAAAGYDPFVD